MPINGEYDIIVHTPAGDREAHLSLHSDGHHLTGQTCTAGHCEQIEHGSVHDSHFEWSSELADPHTTMHFKANCEDDVCSIIAGEVHVEGVGDFHFTGARK